MKRISTIAFFALILAASPLAAQGPDIRIVDDKVSMHVSSVPLWRLLHLFDMATGMTSKAPPELAGRTVSVQFSDLDMTAAVNKIFEGQMLDYIYVAGQGIIVTAAAQPPSSRAGAPAATPFPRDPSPFDSGPAFPQDQPAFVQDPLNNPGAIGIAPGVPPGAQGANPFGNQAQPAVIQTPFGPIPNPRLNQNGNVPQNNAPLAGPGATPFGNPFGGVTPFGQPQNVGQPNPFGQPGLPDNPFGNPTASTPGASPIAPISTPPLVPNQQAPK